MSHPHETDAVDPSKTSLTTAHDDEHETTAPTPESELADDLRSIRAVGENRTGER
ncbi:hypothetical protein SCB71_18245 [Herbiconiux sp. KACC 21604]|uniref:hypothetical protein n=1 Tax=unclassified Herbiconiux TaxID=2618217 RepID=UPI001492BDD9|nr:hypothetical protein [Herbiconiux sp. SALV-R1]QJU55004.1 hypothetical protein HL652_16190 [Herbiconiux sp. SALV-R1]WPO86137.1 hypothetical protein SCB71_18245 [Herbiconiux sp. KACC 21604]